MAGFDEEMNAESFDGKFKLTKEQMLHKIQFRDRFVDKKLEELLNEFGNREAKSCVNFGSRKEEDPRKVVTWPVGCNIGPIRVDDPPKPLDDPFPNNCYH